MSNESHRKLVSVIRRLLWNALSEFIVCSMTSVLSNQGRLFMKVVLFCFQRVWCTFTRGVRGGCNRNFGRGYSSGVNSGVPNTVGCVGKFFEFWQIAGRILKTVR